MNWTNQKVPQAECETETRVCHSIPFSTSSSLSVQNGTAFFVRLEPLLNLLQSLPHSSARSNNSSKRPTLSSKIVLPGLVIAQANLILMEAEMGEGCVALQCICQSLWQQMCNLNGNREVLLRGAQTQA